MTHLNIFPDFHYDELARVGDLVLMKYKESDTFALVNYRSKDVIYLEDFELKDLGKLFSNLGDLERLMKKLSHSFSYEQQGGSE